LRHNYMHLLHQIGVAQQEVDRLTRISEEVHRLATTLFVEAATTHVEVNGEVE
jgi:hypothetical protein